MKRYLVFTGWYHETTGWGDFVGDADTLPQCSELIWRRSKTSPLGFEFWHIVDLMNDVISQGRPEDTQSPDWQSRLDWQPIERKA